jgi:hypothetical protein
MNRLLLPAILPLPLLCCGCYNLVFVNIGSVNRQPSTAPQVQCGTLSSIEAIKICERAVSAQKAIDQRKGRTP